MMATALRKFLLMVLVACALVSWLLAPSMGWPAAALLSAVIAIALHGLVVAAGCLVAHLCTRRASQVDGWGWFAAWPGETLLSLRNMYLDIPWRHKWPARLPAQAKGCLLLVHGYGCNRGIWYGVDRWLAGLGWAVDACNLEPPHADIDDSGIQVAQAAERLCARTGYASVIIIAHSMGGLVARAALRHAPNAPISHVITVGTPHYGTWHARLGRGACAAQMRPGCEWLHALPGAEPPALAARFTSIASRHDNIVSPIECALLKGSRQFVRERVGHMAMLYDRQVRDYIEQRLESLGPKT